MAAAFLCIAAAPASAPPVREPFVQSSNAFAVDFYKAVGQQDTTENVFISPTSASTALVMAYSGARGATAAEMARVLHLGGTQAEVDASAGRLVGELGLSVDKPKSGLGRWWEGLTRRLAKWWRGLMRLIGLADDREASPGSELKLHVANAVWLDRTLRLAPGYQASMQENYRSELPRLDFREGEKARRKINAWAADKTEGRIRDLLSEPPPGPMVITSAVYMKADWAKPFHAGSTEETQFNVARSTGAPVRLMHDQRALRHFRGPGFQLVRLPYVGDRLSMAVFLPDQIDGLAAFERGLTAARLEQWLAELDKSPAKDVQLSLPKFRLERNVPMTALLQRLGMRRPFTHAADFSGMTGQPGLYIGEVFQKSFVAVDEEGTEAAAVTVVALRVDLPPKLEPVVFRADHPFLFLIRDERTGAVLFIGRLVKPAG